MSDTYYAIEDSTLTNIADAIRAKGISGMMTPAEMPQKIADIPTGGVIIKPVIQRGNAERIDMWQGDDYIVADLGMEMPAYSTADKTIVTGATLSPTHTLDWVDYCYIVILRGLAYPIYNTTTKAKGMNELCVNGWQYECVDVPPNTIHSIDKTKAITSRSAALTSMGSVGRTIYWTSSTAMTYVSNSTYGVSIRAQAPTISSSVLTIKAPSYGYRCHTTYCTSANWAKITDIRYQWIIELWRAPKEYTADGFNLSQLVNHTVTDMNENDNTMRPL